MRVVIQRVSEAAVKIEGSIVGQIEQGLLVLLGIEHDDTQKDADYLLQKLINLRIFSDADGKMNLSVQEVNGGILVVSQFTLHAATKKGNRPSYIRAARPEQAIPSRISDSEATNSFAPVSAIILERTSDPAPMTSTRPGCI